MSAKIKLNAASGGGSVSLKAPSTTTSNAAVELQLPVADGSADQFIKTDGSGNLSFAAAGGGKVKQVVYKNVTNSFSTTSNSYSDMTQLNLAITPTSSSNILYFDTNLSSVKLYDTSGADHRGYIALTDDGASSYLQEEQFRIYEYGSGYHLGLFLMKTFSFTHIKTAGSTSARTYQMRFKLTAGEQFEVNAAGQTSTMVIWEIEP